MLISFSRRFVFIASPKNGSTTIEELLRPYSEIALTHTRHGKHLLYRQIAKGFGFLFLKGGLPIERFFRFGVVREPLDWIVSWYNYRSREGMAQEDGSHSANSTRGVSFEEFALEYMRPGDRRPFARLGSQAAMFRDNDGNLGVDYLIPLHRLNQDLPEMARALRIDAEVAPAEATRNVSPKLIRAADVEPGLARRLREHVAADVALYKKAEEGGFGDLQEVMRVKRRKAWRHQQQKGGGGPRQRRAQRPRDARPDE